MNVLLNKLLHVYMAPADDDNPGGGADRGDDFIPTDDPADPPAGKEGAGDGAEDPANPDDPDGADDPDDPDNKGGKEADGKDDGKDDDKAGKGAKDGKGTKGLIPLERHKAILEKEREQRQALENEVANLRGATKVADMNEKISEQEKKLLEMEEKYTQLMVDGETEKATAMMRDIRKTERAISEQRTAFEVQAAEARAVERVTYRTTLERLEQQFPAINPESDEYDKALENEVAELAEAFQLKGLAPSKALQRAVKYVLGTETKAQKEATEVTPRATKEDVAAERAAAARKAAAAAAQAQPPSTARVGKDTGTVTTLTAKDVSQMSQDEFSKLSDDDLKKIRGDAA